MCTNGSFIAGNTNASEWFVGSQFYSNGNQIMFSFLWNAQTKRMISWVFWFFTSNSECFHLHLPLHLLKVVHQFHWDYYQHPWEVRSNLNHFPIQMLRSDEKAKISCVKCNMQYYGKGVINIRSSDTFKCYRHCVVK